MTFNLWAKVWRRTLKLRVALWSCVFLGCGGVAFAHEQTIGDETKCSAVTAIMDRQPPDKEQQREALTYIIASMRSLDRAYALKGKGEILAQMTEEGQNGVALVAANRCKTHRDLNIEDVALDTYRNVRIMQSILGFGRPQAKLDEPRAPQHRVAAPLRRPLPVVQASRSNAALR